jgi:DNA helicase-2/ATP-dependent DNA helicase PcrA
MAALVELLGQNTRTVCLADLDQMIYETLPNSGVSAARIEELRARRPAEIALEADSHRDPTNLIPRLGRAILNRQFADDAVTEAVAADRFRVTTYRGHFRDAVPDEISYVARRGAKTIGIFVSQRIMVEEMADLLRTLGIEHEIAGLAAASGHAQVAVAALASFAVGESDWSTVLRRLALFHAASSSARNPPETARNMAFAPELLPAGMQRYFEEVKRSALALADEPLSALLELGRGLWPKIFGGQRGARLWELGVDDLIGQSLPWARQPLDSPTAAVVASVAEERQRYSAVEDIPAYGAPVRLMTTYQAKGRELDAVILVHDGRDILPNAYDRRFVSTSRLHYVAITRARQSVSVFIPETPHPFFAPYARL